MRWGKMPHNEPDICYAWGDGCSKRDSHLLHNAIASKKPDPFASPAFSVMLPSLLESLESAGYDITTLQFSIKKKVKS